MKVKLFATLAVVGAVLVLYSLYVPWLSFTGMFRHVRYGTFEISGSTYGLGCGTVDKTSAKVTVWSGEYWSTVESDFWFGWLSVTGGLLALVFTIVFVKAQKPLIPTLLVLIWGTLPISAFVLATIHYQPKTFVAVGQMYDYPVDIGVVRAGNASVSIGIGPWFSLAGGVLSVLSITLAYYFRSKQK